jgi:solute carrier family 25 (mitochondrial carnitine/acylcarnitine transporter), member 20/29
MTSLLTFYCNLVSSLTPGICSVFVGHPIDLIKVRMQVGGTTISTNGSPTVARTSTISGMLRSILIKEGIPGLYRGVQAPLLAVTPAFAVSFWSYDLASRAILHYSNLHRHDQMTWSHVALAGAFSGIPLAVILGPTERIKCLMQIQKTQHGGFLACFRRVYQEGGIRSVFRGTGITALRDCPGNATYFGTFELVKRFTCQLEGHEKASTFGVLLAGGCAGVMNWIVAIPFDNVKSRWQTAPAGKYTGLVNVLHTLLRNDGPRALFRGIAPALLRAFPANAACLYGVETVKSIIEN